MSGGSKADVNSHCGDKKKNFKKVLCPAFSGGREKLFKLTTVVEVLLEALIAVAPVLINSQCGCVVQFFM